MYGYTGQTNHENHAYRKVFHSFIHFRNTNLLVLQKIRKKMKKKSKTNCEKENVIIFHHSYKTIIAWQIRVRKTETE